MIKNKQMKLYNVFVVAIIVISVSCSSTGRHKPDGAALSDEVCACKMKTKGMKYNDPERVKMWKECLALQGANYKKAVVDADELEIYKKANAECLRNYTLGK